MKSAWNSVFRAAKGYVSPVDARRLANLLIASILTAQPEDEPEDMAREVRRLMLGPEISVDLEQPHWIKLVEAATEAVIADTRNGIHYDDWVREFQCADHGRKSLGAYATPSSFAEAIARAAIPRPQSGSDLRIVDPSCGAGALLVACLDKLAPEVGPSRRLAALNLYGMELDPAARELACLHVWMAAGAHEGDLQRIAKNIRCGNALLHPWHDEAPYDVLVMNPPWESLRHRTADPVQASHRDATLQRINKKTPGNDGLPDLYSCQGSGDRNLCKAFIELAPHLLKASGRLSALIPAAFTSDEGMSELRALYLEHFSIETWTGFENRGKAFDIDSRYKFGILTGAKSRLGTHRLGLRAFAVEPDETEASHVFVSREKLKLIGGPVGIIPDITSEQELDILSTMLLRGKAFFDEGEMGPVRYKREVDLTLGKQKGLFSRLENRPLIWNNDATLRVESSGTFVPVLEGRMVGQYDFFQKSWVEGEGRTAVWRDNGDSPLQSCRPQYVARPTENLQNRLAICDVTSATNTRTVHATVVPDGWVCGNTAPVLSFSSSQAMFAGLAILNSMTFDWLARRIVSGLHLNKFYLSCMKWPDLASNEMKVLAEAGRILAASVPRPPLELGSASNGESENKSAAVEALVAKGYGLSPTELTFMLSNDVRDRRGFWRYFASMPSSRKVAARSTELLSLMR